MVRTQRTSKLHHQGARRRQGAVAGVQARSCTPQTERRLSQKERETQRHVLESLDNTYAVEKRPERIESNRTVGCTLQCVLEKSHWTTSPIGLLRSILKYGPDVVEIIHFWIVNKNKVFNGVLQLRARER